MKKQSELLAAIVAEVVPFLLEHGFKRKDSWTFIRSFPDDYRRREQLTFTARAHSNAVDIIDLGALVGIYYPSVRHAEKNFVDDELTKYPIIAGSISQFGARNKYFSITYQAGQVKERIVAELLSELRTGAFTLLHVFPNLESMIRGVRNKHPLLYEYHRFKDARRQVTVAAMILVAEGRAPTEVWIRANAPENIFLKAFV